MITKLYVIHYLLRCWLLIRRLFSLSPIYPFLIWWLVHAWREFTVWKLRKFTFVTFFPQKLREINGFITKSHCKPFSRNISQVRESKFQASHTVFLVPTRTKKWHSQPPSCKKILRLTYWCTITSMLSRWAIIKSNETFWNNFPT